MQAYLYLIDADYGYGLEPKNILIMGDSAGGGLALATMLYLRDYALPQLEGAVLLSVRGNVYATSCTSTEHVS